MVVVSALIKLSINNPNTLIPIPMAVKILGSFLSDNLPENDATIAIKIGCATSTIPASRACMPFTYWRYKLSINDIENVAA